MTREEKKAEMKIGLDDISIKLDGLGKMQTSGDPMLIVGVLAAALGSVLAKIEKGNGGKKMPKDMLNGILDSAKVQVYLGRGMSEEKAFEKAGIDLEDVAIIERGRVRSDARKEMEEAKEDESVFDPRFFDELLDK